MDMETHTIARLRLARISKYLVTGFKRSCTISVNDRSLHDGFSLFLPYLTMLTIYKGGHATVDLLLEVSLPPKAVIARMCESPCPLRRSITLHFHVL